MLNVYEFRSNNLHLFSTFLCPPPLSLAVCVYTARAIAKAIAQNIAATHEHGGHTWGLRRRGGVALCYGQLLNLIRKSEQLTYKHLPLEATQQ